MNVIERGLRAVDRFQQRHRVLAFAFAVNQKFGNDNGGYLAALIAYYGFFSLFPLLLVFVSVLGILAGGSGALQQKILGSALRNFPVIGPDIQRNIHSIHGSGLTLAVGIAVTLWAGMGVTQAAEYAMNVIWDVPKKDWPNFWLRRLRGILMLALLGTMAVVSTFLSGLGSTGGHAPVWARVGGIALALVLNVGLYLVAFRVLTRKDLGWGDVLPGSVLGGVLWTVLQTWGGYYVTHQLKGASNVYGTFAIVIGLLVWIYFAAQITLYCAEVNVVRARRLWPRSMIQPPLVEADRRVLAEGAKVEERRPEMQVEVRFETEHAGDSPEGGGTVTPLRPPGPPPATPPPTGTRPRRPA